VEMSTISRFSLITVKEIPQQLFYPLDSRNTKKLNNQILKC
jgi:hypothetical protein